MQILASDDAVTPDKLKEAAHSVSVETAEREKDLAKALGLATSQQEVPKGIGEKLIGAVTVLQLEASKAFSRLSQIELGAALPRSNEKSSETRLEELRDAIAIFLESVKATIEQRYEWWKRECEPHSRASLLLVASRYYDHDKQLCPVCERSIASLPVMQELVELKELPEELQRAIEDFFRDLDDKLDAILPSSIAGLIADPDSKQVVVRRFAALREQAGLSQKELARRLKTSQQQISRLESPDYEGHSLANLRRVAEVLHARVRVVFEREEKDTGKGAAEAAAQYRVKRTSVKRS